MPRSDPENKEYVVRWFQQIKPASVLDVGAGVGTYSQLLRGISAARWTAIEAWGPYVDRFGLRALYDEVIVADVRHMDPALFCVDLVIMGDMLEHMSTSEARTVIEMAVTRAANVIISVPMLHEPQDAWEGNWFERHIDHWKFDDMLAVLADGLAGSVRGEQLAYFWWSHQPVAVQDA